MVETLKIAKSEPQHIYLLLSRCNKQRKKSPYMRSPYDALRPTVLYCRVSKPAVRPVCGGLDDL